MLQVADFKPDPKEYDDFKWFSADEILEGEFHPALKAAIRDMRAGKAQAALEAAVRAERPAEEIAALAKDFVAAAHRPTRTPVKVTFEGGKYTSAEIPFPS